MYFQNFPYTYYTLDDRATVQVITNITQRIQLSEELKDNLSLYDEYDVIDGETPEIVADKFYNNTQLHWIILHTNEILDPRFSWPLSTNDLKRYCEGKYANINGIHHYEDANLNYINGNVHLESNVEFRYVSVNNVIQNNTNNGVGYVTAKNSNSNIVVRVTSGGFITGDLIQVSSNTNTKANLTSTSTISGLPVTNLIYEERQNEARRRIRILKTRYVDIVINEFKKKMVE